MALRVLPLSFLLLCLLVLVSAQRSRFPGRRSDTINPRFIVNVIADRKEIRRTAAGLPISPMGRRTKPLTERELTRIASEARSEVENGIKTPRRSRPQNFPFGPQLVSSPEAQQIGRSGQMFLKASKGVRAGRSGVSTESLPGLGGDIGDRLDCPFRERIECNPKAKYRTITGVCNNLLWNPRWGSALTPFERSAPSAYNDGLEEPRSHSVLSGDLPLPRVISTSMHAASDVRSLDIRFTHITMEFGQFVSHDIERFAPILTPGGDELVCCENERPLDIEGCLPIDIPRNDTFFSPFNRRCMEFARALSTPPLSCKLGPREQLNQESAYLDGSAVYGSTDDLARELRTLQGGLLKTTNSPDGELLLLDPELRSPECRSQSNRLCFKAGDPRVNQQPALMSMHTLWLREHNRVARELSRLMPSWNDEKLYQEARRIVSAEFQHVVYDEFLPVVVGDPVARAFDFPAKSSGYNSDYQPGFNAQIRSAFSAAGYRFGHSLVQTFFADDLRFRDHFLRPDTLYEPSRGPSFVLEELASNKQQKCDRLISSQLTNTLFQQVPGGGIDLAATNIQRGRDFGIPSYNLFRVLCGLRPATHFGTGPGGLVDHTPDAARILGSTYRHVDDIDLWTGAVSERVISGAVVGPTIACVIGRQFFLLKKGDRFFYENDDPNARFELKQLDQIRKTSLARIICDNTRVTSIQGQVFRYADDRSNRRVDCSKIPSVDLSQFVDCVPGGWSAWTSYTGCFSGLKFQFRFCNNPPPSRCGTCTGPSFRYATCNTRTRSKPSDSDVRKALRRIAPPTFDFGQL